MILNGAQRGNAKKLALHLLNDEDNDFVEVHEISGFLSDDLTGAFKEVQAIAKGTRCTQLFFSVSLNPPSDASVTIEMFEATIDKIAETNGLTGQPRAIVFHEKDGRRHAHAVWSRIDAETMTARNLPHFKNRLQTISRDLFLEHHWKLPPGLRDRSLKSPTNVTLAEWQSAKRRGRNAIDQKKLIQECWAVSDSRAGFEAALGERGYILARGNRRSHVIVAHDGEVFAVARAVGLKTKLVRERLGDAEALPSVDQALQKHRTSVRNQFRRFAGDIRKDLSEKRTQLNKERDRMVARHRKERLMLDNGQASRWQNESRQRAARLRKGVSGLWQRITGERMRIQTQNEAAAYAALKRDREQRQTLIEAQLSERRTLETLRTEIRQKIIGLVKDLKNDRDALIAKLTEPRSGTSKPSRRRQRQEQVHEPNPSLDLDI